MRSQQPPAAATATATATTTAPAQSSQQSATPQAAAAETAAAKAKRIKSGDYRAWDRFDVDAQLAELEAEEQRAAAAEAYKGAADVPEGAQRRACMPAYLRQQPLLTQPSPQTPPALTTTVFATTWQRWRRRM